MSDNPLNAVPLSGAARAGVGSNPVTVWTKTLDLLVMVAIPLLIPAGILVFTRGSFFSLSVLDLAFSFVGVSVACMSRGLVDKAEPWKVLSVASFIVACIQTGIGVASDTAQDTRRTLQSILDMKAEGAAAALPHVQADVNLLLQSQSFHWIGALLFGIGLIVILFVVVWREA